MIWLLIALLVAATVQDLWRREVSDAFPILIALSGISAIAMGYWPLSWVASLLGVCVGLAMTAVFFHFEMLGGGDVKLIMALGIWFGPIALLWVLLLIALFGGVLACVAALRRQKDLAYVPAITAGVTLHVGFPNLLFTVLDLSR